MSIAVEFPGYGRIILGDALSVLRGMADASVDAVVTDPPYNVGFDYATHDDSMTGEQYKAWCSEWFFELDRVSRGPILISCGIVNLGMWHQIRSPTWVLCWWKPACMGRSPIGFNNWEPVLHYGKKEGKGSCDVFEAIIKPDPQLNGHPCPKPLAWATKQIRNYIPKSATILDPFLGSGTTAVAAAMDGRQFIGIEKDAKYFAMSRNRFEKFIRPGMFAGVS